MAAIFDDGLKATEPQEMDPGKLAAWNAFMDPSEPGYKGFKEYTPGFLKAYDPWVLGFMTTRVWKMGAAPGLDIYGNHMGRRHLDVGSGTGYFIVTSSKHTKNAKTSTNQSLTSPARSGMPLFVGGPLSVSARRTDQLQTIL